MAQQILTEVCSWSFRHRNNTFLSLICQNLKSKNRVQNIKNNFHI